MQGQGGGGRGFARGKVERGSINWLEGGGGRVVWSGAELGFFFKIFITSDIFQDLDLE